MINKGSIIEYGLYPQTIKEEDVKILSFIDGYYLGSDNEYYVLSKAKPFGKYFFSNQLEIEADKEYYFKVEKIKWQVLDVTEKEILLFSKQILDARVFDSKSNIYRYASIRKWLNKNFYNVAFSNQEKKQMLPTLVDEEYDKVFLLSSKEITSSSYGFSSLTREKKPTDYAKANYAFSFIENGNGNYWLRSINKISQEGICYVDYTGYANCNLVPFGVNGVAVAIKISLENNSK